MATLRNVSGEPTTHSAGEVLKVDCLVRDSIFGEGKVKGTVPLDRGLGLNVRVEWLGDGSGKSTSRNADELMRVKGDRQPMIAGAATTWAACRLDWRPI